VSVQIDKGTHTHEHVLARTETDREREREGRVHARTSPYTQTLNKLDLPALLRGDRAARDVCGLICFLENEPGRWASRVQGKCGIVQRERERKRGGREGEGGGGGGGERER
jgi:hypothetical protein